MLSAVVLESNPRKVYLWHKADFGMINSKAFDYCNYFVSQYTINTPIEDLWEVWNAWILYHTNYIR